MAQLLVRDLEESLVDKLKRRAHSHGVSAEEEHRRILRDVLSRPLAGKVSLIEFLLSSEGEAASEVELDLSRSRDLETRQTGF